MSELSPLIGGVGRPLCSACYRKLHKIFNTIRAEIETAEFVNRADPDEVAHNEPSHLDLQYLPSSLVWKPKNWLLKLVQLHCIFVQKDKERMVVFSFLICTCTCQGTRKRWLLKASDPLLEKTI